MSDLTRYPNHKWQPFMVRVVDQRGNSIQYDFKPDSTLQDIADAWSRFSESAKDLDGGFSSRSYGRFGELRALLDALTQKDTDE